MLLWAQGERERAEREREGVLGHVHTPDEHRASQNGFTVVLLFAQLKGRVWPTRVREMESSGAAEQREKERESHKSPAWIVACGS